MTDLAISGVTKRLGDHLAVDDVSFTVRSGEFFVLLGTSGSGKSTLLRLICGLDDPDQGSIKLAGNEISILRPRDRNLGMVFQDYGLYPSLDVRGNIAYGLQARGSVGKDEVARRVTSAAGKLGLEDMLDRSTQDLSGGEQQRVALARAIVKDADAYLYDEPLSNLDPKLRLRARRDILAVHQAKGRPTVYVTHDQSEAFAMADRVAIMAHGRIQQIGTPDELIEVPSNTFVARFLGSPPMNLLPAEVADGVATGAGLHVPLDTTSPDPGGPRQVLVGFRPDALRDAANGSPNVTGSVQAVEDGFGEAAVKFETSGGHHVTALIAGPGNFDVGDQVGFDVAGSVYLFDAETGQALA